MKFQKKINIYHRFECAKAEGLCVIIDVLRAFTTAAFAMAKGVEEILLVATPEEGFEKHIQDKSLILMGEQEGNLIKGFHYGNSPTEMYEAEIKGRRIVQRTSSGTQGVVACQHAPFMLLSSFVVAEATVKRIHDLNPACVSLIVTGRKNGDEDYALAEYLQNKLLGKDVDVESLLNRVRTCPAAKRMLDANPAEYKFGKEDLELAVQIDRFPFAMEVVRRENDLIAKQVFPLSSFSS